MSDAASEKQRALQHVDEILQDSERLFRAVWEHASDAMALSTPDGTVFAANPAYFHLYGYSSEDVIGNNFSIIFPKENRILAQEMYRYFFQSPAISPSVEGPIRRADGTERFVESRYTFIIDQGQRIAMLSIIRDMTEQKKAKEALWISEEKLRVALEVGQMDCWDWDIASNTIHWSANAEAASGLVQGSFSASYETFLELVHPQDRTRVDQEIKRALEEEIDYTIEFRVLNADSILRWARIQGQVFYDEVGKPLQMMGISTKTLPSRCVEEAG